MARDHLSPTRRHALTADALIETAERIIASIESGVVPAPALAEAIPEQPLLSQNYPNPFNPDTLAPVSII